MKRISVIGAGIMASGIVQNFLKHGYEVRVWNRSPKNLEPLVRAGASSSDSPKSVTETCDVIIECVSDDEASRSVWLGDDGILAGATTEKVLITAASLSIAWTDELAGLCENKGYKFLDMPLTGSRAGAEGGTLKLLVGGEAEVLDSIRPELEAISDKIYHFGPSGAGMRFKLILNALQAVQVDTVSQMILLAQKVGLDIPAVHHALFDAPMGPASPAVNSVFKAFDNPGQLNFAVKLVEKDLCYAKAMAAENGMNINLLDETQADYAAAKDVGLADRDWTAIIELFRKGDV